MKALLIYILPLFYFIFLLFPAVSQAQAPAVEWQRVYGGIDGDYAHSVEPTKDGGYIVAGYIENKGGNVIEYHGNPIIEDLWVIKLDKGGNIQWQKSLGSISMETGAFIHQTPDGGYIVAGSSASSSCSITGNHGISLDYWVVKLNSKGDMEWQKMYGGSANDYAYSISLTPDGGYVVAGQTQSNDGDVTVNKGDYDMWVIKINSKGELIWQKSLGGTGYDPAYSVSATADGGCFVAGYTESHDGDITGSHGKSDVWIARLDNNGQVKWQKTYGGSEREEGWAIRSTPDGGCIFTGYTSSNDGDVSGNHQALGASSDFWVVKLNAGGSIQWQKCYGGDFNERPYNLQLTPDGGYVVCGSAESVNGDLKCNKGITDMWVIKLNSSGNLEWQKSMGGSMYEEAFDVQPAADGGFIVVGNTCSKEMQGFHQQTNNGTCADYFIIKLSGIAAASTPPSVKIDPSTAVICSGVKATLRASAVYAGFNPSFQWMKNGVAVGSNSSEYTAADLKDKDVITCTVTAGGGCDVSPLSATDQVVVKLISPAVHPQITISADNNLICGCTTVHFKADIAQAGTNSFYQWNVNNIPVDENENYFITKDLKPGDVITCNYSDNNTCGVNGAILSNSITMVTGAGQNATVAITASQNNICAGSKVIFTATPSNAGVNPTYHWKVNGTAAGTNTLAFTSTSLNNGDQVSCTIDPDPANTCGGSNSATSNIITVSVADKLVPSVTILTSTVDVCQGDIVYFAAAPTNGGAVPVYQWMINGTIVKKGDGFFNSSDLKNNDVISCSMLPDPDFTCAAASSALSDPITIHVEVPLIPSISVQPLSASVCKGSQLTFNAALQNGGAQPSYQWKLNGAAIGNNSPSFTSTTFSNGDELHCDVIQDNLACADQTVSSNSVLINVKDTPVVSIHPADTLISMGSHMTLNAAVISNGFDFSWYPANRLSDPLSLSPVISDLTENTTFVLKVRDNNGCDATAYSIIRLFSNFYMPSAFTPNADGKNDVYRIPPYVSLKLKEFSIYDRWGHKVFATTDRTKGWDGRSRGIEAGSGVYIYVITGSNEKGNQSYKGSFVLLR